MEYELVNIALPSLVFLGSCLVAYSMYGYVGQIRNYYGGKSVIADLEESVTKRVSGTVESVNEVTVPFLDGEAEMVVSYARYSREAETLKDPSELGSFNTNTLEVASEARVFGDKIKVSDSTGTVTVELPDKMDDFQYQVQAGDHMHLRDSGKEMRTIDDPDEESFGSVEREHFSEKARSLKSRGFFTTHWIPDGDEVKIVGSPTRKNGEWVFEEGDYTLYKGSPSFLIPGIFFINSVGMAVATFSYLLYYLLL